MTDALPPLDPTRSPEHAAVVSLALAVRDGGGRALLVGGWVRDALLTRLGRGQPSKDLDVEVFGIELGALKELLSSLGSVDEVGASFAVLRVRGIDVDFSLPRRDTKSGAGHRGFLVAADPSMSFADAARRRDFTINSISMDPLTGHVIDPTGGVADLKAGVLAATDRETFGEDPLRALRAVQMTARFALEPAPDLPALMREQDLSELPAERLETELRKLLLRGVEPSRGLELLRSGGGVRALPGLDANDATWQLRAMALDRWVGSRPPLPAALPEGWALLVAGASRKQRIKLLERVRPPVVVQKACHTLSDAPALIPDAPALRRLARRLEAGGTTVASLARVRTAQGVDCEAAVALATKLGLLERGPIDAVLGRDLLARGYAPGPSLGRLLAACRDAQDETGLTDPEALLAWAAATQES
ncbi:MAG: CCA tRNA nucleotidyltransferase [Deltaproteobacteria bacterium]|nr:CCA tRNA nucleotidyltransferase [Deltaproteobacteria bacterium]